MSESDVARSSESVAALLPKDPRSWIVAFVAIAMAYLIASHGMFFFAAEWQLPLFIGVLGALVASTYAQAGILATANLVVWQITTPPVLHGAARFGAAQWVLSVVLVVGASVGVGLLRERIGGSRRVFELVVSSVLVACVVVNLWSPLLVGAVPPTGYAALSAQTLREVPRAGHYVNDDAIYRRVFYLMHAGTPYYQAFREAWTGLQNRPPLPGSVFAYRLPTMYWLWNLLPADAFLVVMVFLAFASAGCVAAAFITGQLVGERFAPLAAAALAAYAMGTAATVYVTYVDLPSAAFALIGVALFVRAAVADDDRVLWAAAAVMTGAALTREILVYLIGLAALSALFESRGRRVRKMLPWLVALWVFTIGYAIHAYEVQTLIANRIGVISWTKGSPAFAIDAIRRFSDVMTGGGLLLPVLFCFGVAGAWGAGRRARRPFAIFSAAALVIPVVAMVKLGNPGIDATGLQVNYWGNLVVPLALSLWPAYALLLPN